MTSVTLHHRPRGRCCATPGAETGPERLFEMTCWPGTELGQAPGCEPVSLPVTTVLPITLRRSCYCSRDVFRPGPWGNTRSVLSTGQCRAARKQGQPAHCPIQGNCRRPCALGPASSRHAGLGSRASLSAHGHLLFTPVHAWQNRPRYTSSGRSPRSYRPLSEG